MNATTPTRLLFRLFGVDYLAAPGWWFSLVYPFIAGILLSLLQPGPADAGGRVVTGLGYGLALLLAYHLHTLGHLFSGRLVGGPMQANVIGPLRQSNHYDDPPGLPSIVHVGRALGGPLANLMAGAAALALNGAVNSPVLHFFGVVNLLLVGALAPLPTLDGAVLIRELRRWTPRR